MNTVTFSIAATAENAETISKITNLLTGKAAKAQPELETRGKAAPAKTDTKAAKTEEADDAITLAQFKAAVKQAKTEYDEDFVMKAIESTGTTMGSTLGRTVSKVDASDYQTIMDIFSEGPQEEAGDDDLDEDDGLDDDDDLGEEEPEVDADAVKTALRAYSKSAGRDEAKALMTKYKCANLGAVEKLKPVQLAELMAELV